MLNEIQHLHLFSDHYDFAVRYVRGCSPEQEKQSIALFPSSREGEDYSAPNDQPVHQEGQEETDQCECKPLAWRSLNLRYTYSMSLNISLMFG